METRKTRADVLMMNELCKDRSKECNGSESGRTNEIKANERNAQFLVRLLLFAFVSSKCLN